MAQGERRREIPEYLQGDLIERLSITEEELTILSNTASIESQYLHHVLSEQAKILTIADRVVEKQGLSGERFNQAVSANDDALQVWASQNFAVNATDEDIHSQREKIRKTQDARRLFAQIAEDLGVATEVVEKTAEHYMTWRDFIVANFRETGGTPTPEELGTLIGDVLTVDIPTLEEVIEGKPEPEDEVKDKTPQNKRKNLSWKKILGEEAYREYQEKDASFSNQFNYALTILIQSHPAFESFQATNEKQADLHGALELLTILSVEDVRKYLNLRDQRSKYVSAERIVSLIYRMNPDQNGDVREFRKPEEFRETVRDILETEKYEDKESIIDILTDIEKRDDTTPHEDTFIEFLGGGTEDRNPQPHQQDIEPVYAAVDGGDNGAKFAQTKEGVRKEVEFMMNAIKKSAEQNRLTLNWPLSIRQVAELSGMHENEISGYFREGLLKNSTPQRIQEVDLINVLIYRMYEDDLNIRGANKENVLSQIRRAYDMLNFPSDF